MTLSSRSYIIREGMSHPVQGLTPHNEVEHRQDDEDEIIFYDDDEENRQDFRDDEDSRDYSYQTSHSVNYPWVYTTDRLDDCSTISSASLPSYASKSTTPNCRSPRVAHVGTPLDPLHEEVVLRNTKLNSTINFGQFEDEQADFDVTPVHDSSKCTFHDIDISPDSPASISCDGRRLNFNDHYKVSPQSEHHENNSLYQCHKNPIVRTWNRMAHPVWKYSQYNEEEELEIQAQGREGERVRESPDDESSN